MGHGVLSGIRVADCSLLAGPYATMTPRIKDLE